MRASHFLVTSLSVSLLAAASAAQAQTPTPARTHVYDLPAQDLGTALRTIGKLSREQVAFDARIVRGKRAPALNGSYTFEEAVHRLLSGANLTLSRGVNGVWRISAAGEPSTRLVKDDQGGAGIPDIVVTGARSLNVDIRRSKDDPQPYVVFDSDDIQNSQSTTTEEFLRTRLPMNAVNAAPGQNATGTSVNNMSQIDLRGLGAAQTLILVDGRRRAAPLVRIGGGSDFTQPDINGIPVSAIERIEVLPSGAGGIYGGGATGGVINIVLKRDYSGFEGGVTYADSFKFDVPRRRYDLSGSFGIGRSTRFTFSGSYANGGDLKVGERDFAARSRSALMKNNPDAILVDALVPPVGYTPNIRSVDGRPLVLKDGRSLGSAITHVPIGYPGWGGLSANNVAGLLANAGTYNLDLATGMSGEEANLLATPETLSLNGNVERTFGDRLRVFVEANYASNRATTDTAQTSNLSTVAAAAAINPFQQAVRVSYETPGYIGRTRQESTATGVTGGFVYSPGGGWTVAADHAWSRSTTKLDSTIGSLLPGTTAQFLNGSINVIADTNVYRPDFGAFIVPYPATSNGLAAVQLNDTNLRLSGRLFRLPGGPVTISTLLEHRNQVAEAASDFSYLGSGIYANYYRPKRSQSVDSAYAELRVPIVGPDNGMSFANAIELQASVRHDRYITRTVTEPSITTIGFGNIPIDPADYTITPVTGRVRATRYTVGASWKPIPDVQLRASYATAFLPPTINQLGSITRILVNEPIVNDPVAGSYTAAEIVNESGGNPNLQPENSSSLSMGVIFEPTFARGFRMSADYTRINKTNEIDSLSVASIIALEGRYPDRVTRDPVTKQVVYVNNTLLNFLNSKIEAYDFQMDYELDAGLAGKLRFNGVATYQPNVARVLSLDADPTRYAGNLDGPLKWRGNGGIAWTKDGFSAGWNAQYYGRYSVYSSGLDEEDIANAIQNQGRSHIPAQVYHDVIFTYRAGAAGIFGNEALRNTTFLLGIQNVLNKYPPVFAGSSYLGGYSTYGDPRLRRFSLSVRKSF